MSPRTINPESNYEVIDLSSSPPAGLTSDDSKCKDNEDLRSTWLNLVSYVAIIYRKLRKLRRRKVSRFIGFYYNVGKTFVVLLLIA